MTPRNDPYQVCTAPRPRRLELHLVPQRGGRSGPGTGPREFDETKRLLVSPLQRDFGRGAAVHHALLIATTCRCGQEARWHQVHALRCAHLCRFLYTQTSRGRRGHAPLTGLPHALLRWPPPAPVLADVSRVTLISFLLLKLAPGDPISFRLTRPECRHATELDAGAI